MSSRANELSPAGWPRPWLLWTPRAEALSSAIGPQVLPIPWVNGVHPYHGDWATFDEARAAQAREQRLCAVCGQPLDQIALLGRAAERITSGPGCHPRCMKLTLTTCPHFTNPAGPTSSNRAVAWRVDGPDLGYATAGDDGKPYDGLQLVADGLPELTSRDIELLAGVDPWGTGRSDATDADDTVADN